MPLLGESAATSSAGVAAQKSAGRQPSSRAASPNRPSAAEPKRSSSLALQNLAEQAAQRLGAGGKAKARNRFADIVAGEAPAILQAVPKQRRHLGQLELARAGPFDQREQWPEFVFGRDQRREARTQQRGAPAMASSASPRCGLAVMPRSS